ESKRPTARHDPVPIHVGKEVMVTEKGPCEAVDGGHRAEAHPPCRRPDGDLDKGIEGFLTRPPGEGREERGERIGTYAAERILELRVALDRKQLMMKMQRKCPRARRTATCCFL